MIRVQGGVRLDGTVPVSGAKNAALPAVLATLLTDQPVQIANAPHLADVETALELARALGKSANWEGDRLTLSGAVSVTRAPEDVVRRMRASFLALGPLLARLGQAEVPLPGGCAIGARPVDLHLRGLAALGAEVSIEHGIVRAQGALKGAVVHLDYPSVGATEQLMLAAALAKGVTVIVNPAREPEIEDLCALLSSMGASTHWEADRLSVAGQPALGGASHRVMPDRIEAGTYLLAGALVGGEVRVANIRPQHLEALLAKLSQAGLGLARGDDWVRITREGTPCAIDVETAPYPGFPTDLQAPWIAFLTSTEGRGVVRESVFESRFAHVPELRRMGASIDLEARTAIVLGPTPLQGAAVKVPDIRAGAALLLAALAASGETALDGIALLRRGYERPVDKLRTLGASIWET